MENKQQRAPRIRGGSWRISRTVLPALGLALTLGAGLPAKGAEFLLKDGKRLNGEVVYASQSALVIREKGGAVQQLSRRALDKVDIWTRKHGRLSGDLLGWSDGRYRLETKDKVFEIKGRRVLAETARETAKQQAAKASMEKASKEEASLKKPAPAAVKAVESAPVQSASESNTGDGAGKKQTVKAETAAATKDPAKPATKTGAQKVIVTAGEASEQAEAIVFELSLSAAVAKEVLIIYATADGTARAEADYTGLSGAVILQPGAAATKIQVPLLDDNLAEGAETFDLLVSSDLDPDDVTIERVPATILDNETTTARN